ncbi:hypothetical protein F4678DRAFT_17712 [Xylaria arbuscula]|nr:hypothetical protein F4678DRAFT_17712 [Xylaria arbuscula]
MSSTVEHSQEAVDSANRLYRCIGSLFPVAASEFQSQWAAAHAVCHSQSTTTRDDACIRTPELNALYRLGPKIIPFVVFKLANDNAGQDLWAVLLYNALENDPKCRPNLLADQDLRRGSKMIAELNYQRNKTVKELVDGWKEHHIENMIYSSSVFFTECEPYWDLVAMGPSIIAHLMVGYTEYRDGYWYELLHEIVHGHKMRAHMIQRPVVYDAWCHWFNWGEQSQVPEYIPTDADRRIYHIK